MDGVNAAQSLVRLDWNKVFVFDCVCVWVCLSVCVYVCACVCACCFLYTSYGADEGECLALCASSVYKVHRS